MLDLRPHRKLSNLPKIFGALGHSKVEVILYFIPSTEYHKLLIFALLINAPCTAVRKWCRGSTQVTLTSLVGNVEFVLLACLNEIPTYTKNWCIKRDSGCGWLVYAVSLVT
jgi:hypothetical protein